MIRVLLLTLLVLTACAPAPGPRPSTGPLVLRLSVDEASPQRVDVARGRAVELTVTSSRPVEVHVHGFDVLATAKPDEPAELRFTADRTGTFDVEAHPDTLLVRLVVR